ncbi:MAG: class I SAM-dependent methyltransferase [Candidatus Omnitrophota bacterium]
MTTKDNVLTRDWDDYWSSECHNIDRGMQCNLDSHQGKVTFGLLDKSKAGKMVLEAGCGLGNWIFLFEKRGFKPVGIDLSLSSLKIASEYGRRNRLKANLSLADVRKLPFKDNTFDAIVSYGVIEHFPDSGAAVKEFHRVLKPSGACLITTPNPFSFHRLIGRHILNITKSRKLGYVGYENAFTPAGLTRLLKDSGFTKTENGILSDGMGTLFGVFWPGIPVIGKGLHRLFSKIAAFIENRQNVVGGGSYAIGYKE